MTISERLGHAYLFAKQYVINNGYANEIDWQTELKSDFLTEEIFLNEIAWVILASGMNDKIVRKVFPLIKSQMFDFKHTKKIAKEKNRCLNAALTFFNHPGKIKAILFVADYLSKTPFEHVKLQLFSEGISYIQTFPYMGNATAFHFAKNIGMDVVKPDRHLIRISQALGYESPKDLCQEISDKIDERVSIIDLVIWRYATLDKNYLKNIEKYIVKPN